LTYLMMLLTMQSLVLRETSFQAVLIFWSRIGLNVLSESSLLRQACFYFFREGFLSLFLFTLPLWMTFLLPFRIFQPSFRVPFFFRCMLDAWLTGQAFREYKRIEFIVLFLKRKNHLIFIFICCVYIYVYFI
jgi:hypothetical protein